MINPKELSTDELYFADEHYMSVSRFKKLEKCEVDGLSDWKKPSTAMMVGSYVDAFVSGTLEKFKLEHPEIISSRGTTKGELKSEYKQADLICEHIMKDEILQQFMSGDKQTVMTGEIEGVPFKIKMDSYSKGIAINDLKIMASVTDRIGNYIDFITPYGYDIQLAVYQEIVRQNTDEKLPCFIVAITKEEPINSVIVAIPQVILDRALYRVQSQIKHLYDIKLGNIPAIGCGKCDSCVSKRKATPIISMEQFYNY